MQMKIAIESVATFNLFSRPKAIETFLNFSSLFKILELCQLNEH